MYNFKTFCMIQQVKYNMIKHIGLDFFPCLTNVGKYLKLIVDPYACIKKYFKSCYHSVYAV